MALTGNEVIYVLGQDATGRPAATEEQTTTGAIAALASTQSTPLVNTAISTVGAGTLTAAGLVGGLITRTGPVADYTDTTATAAAIIAALPGYVLNETFMVRIKNATAFTQTIAAGVGVTPPVALVIPPWSMGNYYMQVTSPTAVTLFHINTLAITTGKSLTETSTTALATVGAGTILAPGFNGGIVVRSGAQSSTAFTDTTDTAANIIAGLANINNKIGTSFFFVYQNTTNSPATITGGVGMTVSGVTVVPANSSARYLVTYTAAATMTMVGISLSMMPTQGTFTATTTSAVTVANAAVGPASQILFTLKTTGGTVAGVPYVFTVTPGTGFTVKSSASDTSVYNYTILG